MIRVPATPAMRRHLVASVCSGVLTSGTTIACAVVLARIVARLVTDPAARNVAQCAPMLSILLVLWTIRVLAQWQQARLGQRGATAAIAELNQRVLTAVTAMAPRDVAGVRDDAAALTMRGLDGLRPYFTRYQPALLLAALLTPAAVIVMACYDLQSAIVVVIALPLVPLFMVLIGLVTRDRSAAALRAMTTLQSRTHDLIAGIPTLRALGRAEGPADRIAALAAAQRRSTMATLRIAFLSSLVLELLATLGVALVAVSVGLRLVFGDVTLTAGLTALLLAPEVFWPLRRVGTEFHAAQDGQAAAAETVRLLAGVRVPQLGATAPDGRVIRLDAVCVAGRDGDAPHDLTVDVEPGVVTVLTGPNGCGKSTALDVMLGLSRPTAGHVLIGGVDVADVDLQVWWRDVAWLPHRPVLVPGTVRANLDLFGPLVDVESTCRAVGFDEVLATLPDGLDTVIGRSGTGLSLGQRQRLALARVLGSPKQVLLLDEPTAHLDEPGEARVLQAIVERARAGAAVVVVAHRRSVVDIGDRVVRMGGELLVRR